DFLQIVQHGQVIVASHFHDYIHLSQWDVAAYAVNQATKALTGIAEGQSGTTLKALMSLQEGCGDEACNVGLFSNINPDIQGSVCQHGQRLEVRACHTRFPFHSASMPHGSLPSVIDVVEKRGSVSVHRPTLDQDFGFQTQTYDILRSWRKQS